MEITKISDRIDVLENQSTDDGEEVKSVGAVNIEFTGRSFNFFLVLFKMRAYCQRFFQAYRI